MTARHGIAKDSRYRGEADVPGGRVAIGNGLSSTPKNHSSSSWRSNSFTSASIALVHIWRIRRVSLSLTMKVQE